MFVCHRVLSVLTAEIPEKNFSVMVLPLTLPNWHIFTLRERSFRNNMKGIHLEGKDMT